MERRDGDAALLNSAARLVAKREQERAKERSKVRFGAKPSHYFEDRLSTKTAPPPKGPPTSELLEDAKRRRRQREEEERNRRG